MLLNQELLWNGGNDRAIGTKVSSATFGSMLYDCMPYEPTRAMRSTKLAINNWHKAAEPEDHCDEQGHARTDTVTLTFLSQLSRLRHRLSLNLSSRVRRAGIDTLATGLQPPSSTAA